MGYYIDQNCRYYEGDKVNRGDIEVSQRPSQYHKYTGEAWELDRTSWLNGTIRPERDRLLDEVDVKNCNADKWETMTAEEKEAWRTYKQALRDLPTTIVYDNEVWPVMPA